MLCWPRLSRGAFHLNTQHPLQAFELRFGVTPMPDQAFAKPFEGTLSGKHAPASPLALTRMPDQTFAWLSEGSLSGKHALARTLALARMPAQTFA